MTSTNSQLYGDRVPLNQMANSYAQLLRLQGLGANGIGSNVGSNLPAQSSPYTNAALSLLGNVVKNKNWFGDAEKGTKGLGNLWENLTTGGGEAAQGANAASGFSIEGAGSAGNFLGPLAGAVGLFDVLGNDREGVRGAAQGALSGASAGSYFGPWGTAIGGILGALSPSLSNIFGGGSDTDIEEGRAKKLFDQGIMPEYSLTKSQNLNTQLFPMLGEGARGFIVNPDGTRIRVNNAFNSSRDESQLQAADLLDRAFVYEKFGSDFNRLSEDTKARLLDTAIQKGLVREHKGTMDWVNNGEVSTKFEQAVKDAIAKLGK